MKSMEYVSKFQARAAAFMVCAASLLAFDRPALADDDDDDTVADSDDADETTQPTSDRTVDGGWSDTDPSALTAYRSELAPYGSWVEDPSYGTVWVPSAASVGTDFAPYQSAGHWDLASDGDWIWMSDYDWGYIPFHYGRWVWISGTGWAWIPGRAYANAWVTWRVGYDGYIGWAPMPPAYYWWGGGVVVLGYPPPAAYAFCETRYVFDHHVDTHVIHQKAQVVQAANGTHPYAPPNRTYTPASPTLKEANIPKGKAPHFFTPPQPKSLKWSKPPSGTTSAPAPSLGRTKKGGAPAHVQGTGGARGTGLVERGATEHAVMDRGLVSRDTVATHRLDTVRTISSEPRMISSEPRMFRNDVRTVPSEVRTLRDSGAVPRDFARSIGPGLEGSRSFDRGVPSRSFDTPRSFDAPRSFDGSRSFDRPRGFDAPRGPSSFQLPRSSSPSYQPHFSPSPSAAPSPPRRSAPPPSFHPSGGGGGHFGGGRHR